MNVSTITPATSTPTKIGPTRTIAALTYTKADCTLTLREALAEYHHSIAGLLSYDDASPLGRELFRRHDVTHVVFGCDTTLPQEAMIDMWSIFGSDVGVGAYLKYLKADEAKTIFETMGYWNVLVGAIRATPALFRIYRASRRMHKKWPWADYDKYLDTPLNELRAEFGISLVSGPKPAAVAPA